MEENCGYLINISKAKAILKSMPCIYVSKSNITALSAIKTSSLFQFKVDYKQIDCIVSASDKSNVFFL